MRGQQSHKRTCFTMVVTAVAATLAGLTARPAMSLPRYNSGCQDCHGAFTDDTSPKGTIFPLGSKHAMHRSPQAMNTDCDLCHTDGDGNNPYTYMSNGTANNPGLGCTGCHGRDYGGDIGNSGVGLRARHTAAGVTLCAMCHLFDATPDPDPMPEYVLPAYYGTPDTNVDDPCNSSGMENWSIGDSDGLDNDGDGYYDGNDADCGVLGDLNCDGVLDLGDVGPFAQALIDPAAHASQFPGCDILKGDLDDSGGVDGLDTQGFIEAIVP